MFSNITPDKMQSYLAGLAVICLALAVVIVGVPSEEELIAARNEARLEARSVYIGGAELLDLMHYGGDDMQLMMVDVRSAEEFENFHLPDALNVHAADITTVLEMEPLASAPETTAVVLMGNDEAASTDAWRVLAADESLYVYMLCGGVNSWLEIYADQTLKDAYIVEDHVEDDDTPAYVFDSSLMAVAGMRRAADPDPAEFPIEYVKTVAIGTGGANAPAEEEAPAADGGCGG